jgi:hypothetical protein
MDVRLFRHIPAMDAAGTRCDAYFEDTVPTERGDVRVYRCDWGWYVKSKEIGVRSRYLDEALEGVLGKLDNGTLRALVDTLGRELTAERDRTGRTATRVLAHAGGEELQAKRELASP